MAQENKSIIILKADGTLQDDELREWFGKLDTRMETLNDRTKLHTFDIKELKKEIKTIKEKQNER